ncbi:MAG TPA: DUF190 domain-containing protein [Thermoanaerobaculia bacterium]|nr:DUF190 domain-containing protein [Thermoanaerobaculia bacterium]
MTAPRRRRSLGSRDHHEPASILSLSTDLPIVVEIVDTREKIDSFLPAVDRAIREGLATNEQVEIRFYR